MFGKSIKLRFNPADIKVEEFFTDRMSGNINAVVKYTFDTSYTRKGERYEIRHTLRRTDGDSMGKSMLENFGLYSGYIGREQVDLFGNKLKSNSAEDKLSDSLSLNFPKSEIRLGDSWEGIYTNSQTKQESQVNFTLLAIENYKRRLVASTSLKYFNSDAPGVPKSVTGELKVDVKTGLILYSNWVESSNALRQEARQFIANVAALS